MPAAGERFDRIADAMPYKPESRALDPRTVIVQPGWNVRDVTTAEAKEHIASIKASILARVNDDPPLSGLIKPIEVRYNRQTGEVTLVDGQCRLVACRELWDEGHEVYVPCKVIEGNEEQLFAASLSSNGGKPLTQWEIGVGCRKLHVGYGWSVDRIAGHIMKSKRYVNEAIALANVPADAKTMLTEGHATAGAVLHAVSGQNGDSLEALKARVASRPAAKAAPQPALPGTPARAAQKPKPVTRPKKQSAADKTAKAAPKLLDLADAMCRLIMDPKMDREEIILAAKAYSKVRGL